MKKILSLCATLSIITMVHASSGDFSYKDWDTAMIGAKFRWGSFKRPDRQWSAQLTELYESSNPDKVARADEPLIPKIIHQIWLGSPMPEKFKKFAQSWQTHHPDWEYHLWTDENVKDIKLINQDKFNRATNWAVKSDILRYELLYQFGGVYADTDFECYAPLDELNYRYAAYAGVPHEPFFSLCNAFIAAAPGHPILKKCINQLKVPRKYTWKEISNGTGPLLFTRIFMESVQAGDQGVIAFPALYFYPIPLHIPKGADPTSYIRPESYGAHYWDASWVK